MVIRQILPLMVSDLEALEEDAWGHQESLCRSISRSSQGKESRLLLCQALCWEIHWQCVSLFLGRIQLLVQTSELAMARNWQMVRNVPSVTCLYDVVFCPNDKLALWSGKTIRSIWCSNWLQNLFVLLESQKLLFGFDMPLKIQDALVNVFDVLNLI